MDYAVILLFNNVSEENINSIILNISKETRNNYMVENNISPHLSISLFEYNESVDKIIKIIEENKNKFKKDLIKIASFGVFNPNVLFLSPVFDKNLSNSNKNIIEILNQIKNIIFNKFYIENNWVPHISLGVKLEQNELLNGIKILTKCFNPMGIEINRIGLVECNPYKEIKIWDL